jgi:hypothetical protein
VVVLILGACGGDDSSTKKDAAIDSSGAVDAMMDAKMIDAPPGTALLTVKNYLNWCEVKIDSGAFMRMDVVTASLAPGTYDVVAKGAAGFEIQPGMWHHVDGTTGNTGVDGNQVGGASGTSTAQVTMTTSAKCVWVCCQFENNGGGCPSTIADQCP